MALTTLPPPTPGADLAPIVAPERPPGALDRWSDPTAVLVATGAFALVALAPSVVRAPITLPLALLLPGHALLAALDRPDRNLSGGARIALRVLLSMATIALTVLAAGSIFGVTRLSVVASVWAVASLAAVAAWNHERPQRTAPVMAGWTQSGVLLALVASVGVILVAAALLLLPAPISEPFSRLSLAGSSKASGTPIVLRQGRTAEVTVEVENGTDETVRYGIIPAIDGGAAWKAKIVRLAPGGTWTGTVSGKVPAAACLTRLTVALSADRKASGVTPLVLYVRNEGGRACS